MHLGAIVLIALIVLACQGPAAAQVDAIPQASGTDVVLGKMSGLAASN
jgi:hypothetical protein